MNESPSQKFYAHADKEGQLKYIHRVKSENDQEKTVWWARVKSDGTFVYVKPPLEKEIENSLKTDFLLGLAADLPLKEYESIIKNNAQEAITKIMAPPASDPVLNSPPPPVVEPTKVRPTRPAPPIPAAAKFPSPGPVAVSKPLPVTPDFEAALFKFGGSLSKNEQGNYFYKHTNGGKITREANGVWRGTPAPPADNLQIQAEHLANDAISLITVDLASQKAGKTDAPINLKMDGIADDNPTKKILEKLVCQKIAEKIQKMPADAKLKNINNSITVNGEPVKPAVAAAPTPVISRSNKENAAPNAPDKNTKTNNALKTSRLGKG